VLFLIIEESIAKAIFSIKVLRQLFSFAKWFFAAEYGNL